MKNTLVIGFLCALAVAAVVVAAVGWIGVGEVEMSWHGYLAMGLGVLAIEVAIALLCLIAFRNRLSAPRSSATGFGAAN